MGFLGEMRVRSGKYGKCGSRAVGKEAWSEMRVSTGNYGNHGDAAHACNYGLFVTRMRTWKYGSFVMRIWNYCSYLPMRIRK